MPWVLGCRSGRNDPRRSRQFEREALVGIEIIPSVGRNQLPFDERVWPKAQSRHGQFTNRYTGGSFQRAYSVSVMTEPYETGALLPMQHIHPLLGSVII
jgi:hypothetical protein